MSVNLSKNTGICTVGVDRSANLVRKVSLAKLGHYTFRDLCT